MHYTEVKLLAYADDIAVFCQDGESVLEVVNLAKAFCKLTSSEINWEMSVGIWHGNWDIKPERFACTTWTGTPTTYLGVPFEHYQEPARYWGDATEKMKERTRNWQGRGLSMFARASACNLFLTAKVWYV